MIISKDVGKWALTVNPGKSVSYLTSRKIPWQSYENLKCILLDSIGLLLDVHEYKDQNIRLFIETLAKQPKWAEQPQCPPIGGEVSLITCLSTQRVSIKGMSLTHMYRLEERFIMYY